MKPFIGRQQELEKLHVLHRKAVPILFHVGGVAASVEMGGYFYRIIDITDFLEE